MAFPELIQTKYFTRYQCSLVGRSAVSSRLDYVSFSPPLLHNIAIQISDQIIESKRIRARILEHGYLFLDLIDKNIEECETLSSLLLTYVNNNK